MRGLMAKMVEMTCRKVELKLGVLDAMEGVLEVSSLSLPHLDL